jgi:hypothetical protein
MIPSAAPGALAALGAEAVTIGLGKNCAVLKLGVKTSPRRVHRRSRQMASGCPAIRSIAIKLPERDKQWKTEMCPGRCALADVP